MPKTATRCPQPPSTTAGFAAVGPQPLCRATVGAPDSLEISRVTNRESRWGCHCPTPHVAARSPAKRVQPPCGDNTLVGKSTTPGPVAVPRRRRASVAVPDTAPAPSSTDHRRRPAALARRSGSDRSWACPNAWLIPIDPASAFGSRRSHHGRAGAAVRRARYSRPTHVDVPAAPAALAPCPHSAPW